MPKCFQKSKLKQVKGDLRVIASRGAPVLPTMEHPPGPDATATSPLLARLPAMRRVTTSPDLIQSHKSSTAGGFTRFSIFPAQLR